jgi:glucosylceramidase
MLLSLAVILLGSQTPLRGQNVKVIVSSQAGDRLSSKPNLHFGGKAGVTGPTFAINDDVTYQKIDGFGASILEAGLICINSLPADKQEVVFGSLFDAQQGAGFSAMKTVIGATDFMSAGLFYTYDDTPVDVAMKDFSIARDLGPNGEITFIKRARKYGS